MALGVTLPAIVWPLKYNPGETDNYVSNEVIATGVTAAKIWDLLADISKWNTYYENCSQITPPASGTILKKGDDFKFSTFGLPALDCHVHESVSPRQGGEGRLAWSAKLDGPPDQFCDVYHAWLIQDLQGGRVRILTQESQIGKPIVEMRETKPNKMLLGHQDWCEGLVAAARGQKVKKTNLGSI